MLATLPRFWTLRMRGIFRMPSEMTVVSGSVVEALFMVRAKSTSGETTVTVDPKVISLLSSVDSGEGISRVHPLPTMLYLQAKARSAGKRSGTLAVFVPAAARLPMATLTALVFRTTSWEEPIASAAGRATT